MVDLAISVPMAWLGPGRIASDVIVACRSGVIERVETGVSDLADDDVETVVLDGFLTPAGADRHVHVELGDPVSLVRRGITAVRDLGWPQDRIFPLVEISEAPGFDGPLIRGVGPMLTAPGGYPTQAEWAPTGTGLEIVDAADAASVVERLAGRGAAAIKVSLNAEAGPTPGDAILAAVCDTAHAHELLVTAHTQGAGEVARALGAGVDELAHTPWTERLSDDLIETAAARMRWVSTLDIHGVGADSPALRTAMDNLARFHRAGGTVVYGTDLGNGPIPSGINTRELQLMHDAGLGTEEVLDALVRAPIEVGAPADLLVLGDSPLGDPSAFDDIRLVVKAGRIVPR
jgi:imidazolonepropionase-like amidohydrolase